MKKKGLIPFKDNLIYKFINFIKKLTRKKKFEVIERDTKLDTTKIEKDIEEYDINYIYKKVKEGTILMDDLSIDDYLGVIELMNKELENKENMVLKGRKILNELK